MPQMFLIMDHDSSAIPTHITQTFRLRPAANGRGWSTDLPGVNIAVEGEEIDLRADGYVVLYAQNDWHARLADTIHDQLRGLKPNATILMLPIEVEEKVKSHHFTIPDISQLGRIMSRNP